MPNVKMTKVDEFDKDKAAVLLSQASPCFRGDNLGERLICGGDDCDFIIGENITLDVLQTKMTTQPGSKLIIDCPGCGAHNLIVDRKI